MQQAAPTVRLAEVVTVFSMAADLGMGQPIEYAVRATLLALRLGERLGLSQAELSDLYYVTLLRLVGCTADAHISASVFGNELEVREWLASVDWGKPAVMIGALVRRLGEGEPPLRRAQIVANAMLNMSKMMGTATAHCEVAQLLADRLGLNDTVQQGLGVVFERWDGKGIPHHVKGEQTLQIARIATFAQDAELFLRLGGIEGAVATARERSGGAYDPKIVELFCRAPEEFMLGSEIESAWDTVLEAEPGPQTVLTDEQVERATRAVADFVDLKSPYTSGHSQGVGDLAESAARASRLSDAECVAVRRAGYLHDLGQSAVPAGVWMKSGPLSDAEWERMRLHPYYTERLLARAGGLSPLGAMASLHHERPDGSGYHRSLPAPMLTPGGRILAAAEAYHAMIEPRPHRPPHTPEAAAAQLRAEARAGRLDGDAVAAVLSAAGHKVSHSRREWPAGLSEREVEVLRLVSRGLTKRQVAEQLVVSPATVDHHVRHIYDKVGVSTRAAVTLFAMQHQLL
jgi:HD-GYP domain-containing protein (c-di-GMP phosphodiesterase class II)